MTLGKEQNLTLRNDFREVVVSVENLHVHDDNGVGPVAHNHLVHVPEHQQLKQEQFSPLL